MLSKGFKVLLLAVGLFAAFLCGILLGERRPDVADNSITEEIRLKVPKSRADLQRRLLMNACEKTMLQEVERWPAFDGATEKKKEKR